VPFSFVQLLGLNFVLGREHHIHYCKNSFGDGHMLCDLWIATKMTDGLLRNKSKCADSLSPKNKFGALSNDLVDSITLITSWLFLSFQYVIICYSWSNFASRDNGFLPFSFWWQWNLRMQKGPHMDIVWEMITSNTQDIGSIDCLVPSCFLLLKRLSKWEEWKHIV